MMKTLVKLNKLNISRRNLAPERCQPKTDEEARKGLSMWQFPHLLQRRTVRCHLKAEKRSMYCRKRQADGGMLRTSLERGGRRVLTLNQFSYPDRHLR